MLQRAFRQLPHKSEQREKQIDKSINHLITLNLFTTITNANFDKDVIVERIKTTLKVKENLLKEVSDKSALPSASLWNGNESEFAAKAATVGVLAYRKRRHKKS